MITKPVIFSETEQKQIENKIKEPNFSAQSWADLCLQNLKYTIKKHYLNEQNTTCPYCRMNLKTKHGRYWDIEHIISRASCDNYMFEPRNLCMSCVECNSAKSTKKVTNSQAKIHYPAKSESFIFVHPHFDNYEENILIIKPGFLYIAKSDKGNKTISICNLNRFYSYAGFGNEVDDDEEMLLLSQSLIKADNKELKKKIRIKIAELAIKAST